MLVVLGVYTLSDHRPDEEGIKSALMRKLQASSLLSDHRPDEEGIKRFAGGWFAGGWFFQTTDLMKKGLRGIRVCRVLRPSLSDHRPDEEGIKSAAVRRKPRKSKFQTTDLMKKGLRGFLPV